MDNKLQDIKVYELPKLHKDNIQQQAIDLAKEFPQLEVDETIHKFVEVKELTRNIDNVKVSISKPNDAYFKLNFQVNTKNLELLWTEKELQFLQEIIRMGINELKVVG